MMRPTQTHYGAAQHSSYAGDQFNAKPAGFASGTGATYPTHVMQPTNRASQQSCSQIEASLMTGAVRGAAPIAGGTGYSYPLTTTTQANVRPIPTSVPTTHSSTSSGLTVEQVERNYMRQIPEKSSGGRVGGVMPSTSTNRAPAYSSGSSGGNSNINAVQNLMNRQRDIDSGAGGYGGRSGSGPLTWGTDTNRRPRNSGNDNYGGGGGGDWNRGGNRDRDNWTRGGGGGGYGRDRDDRDYRDNRDNRGGRGGSRGGKNGRWDDDSNRVRRDRDDYGGGRYDDRDRRGGGGYHKDDYNSRGGGRNDRDRDRGDRGGGRGGSRGDRRGGYDDHRDNRDNRRDDRRDRRDDRGDRRDNRDDRRDRRDDRGGRDRDDKRDNRRDNRDRDGQRDNNRDNRGGRDNKDRGGQRGDRGGRDNRDRDHKDGKRGDRRDNKDRDHRGDRDHKDKKRDRDDKDGKGKKDEKKEKKPKEPKVEDEQTAKLKKQHFKRFIHDDRRRHLRKGESLAVEEDAEIDANQQPLGPADPLAMTEEQYADVVAKSGPGQDCYKDTQKLWVQIGRMKERAENIQPPRAYAPKPPPPLASAIIQSLPGSHRGRADRRALEAFSALALAPEDISSCRSTIESVTTVVTEIWKDAKVQPFGSFVHGLVLKSCISIDLSVQMPQDSDAAPNADSLKQFVAELEKAEFKEVSILESQSRPIVRFSSGEKPIRVNVCFNMGEAVETSNLIAEYCKVDKRLVVLGLIIKYWAARRLMGSAFHYSVEDLSSYGLTLLLINFLQSVEPNPILPNLQSVQECKILKRQLEDRNNKSAEAAEEEAAEEPKFFQNGDALRRFGKKNTRPIGSLLEAFFKHFMNWDWETVVTANRPPKTRKKRERKDKKDKKEDEKEDSKASDDKQEPKKDEEKKDDQDKKGADAKDKEPEKKEEDKKEDAKKDEKKDDKPAEEKKEEKEGDDKEKAEEADDKEEDAPPPPPPELEVDGFTCMQIQDPLHPTKNVASSVSPLKMKEFTWEVTRAYEILSRWQNVNQLCEVFLEVAPIKSKKEDEDENDKDSDKSGDEGEGGDKKEKKPEGDKKEEEKKPEAEESKEKKPEPEKKDEKEKKPAEDTKEEPKKETQKETEGEKKEAAPTPGEENPAPSAPPAPEKEEPTKTGDETAK